MLKTFWKTLLRNDGESTPLPLSTIALIYPMVLFNAMTISTVYSFLPKMVKRFGASEVDAGYQAGLIASSLYVSRTITNILWGYISDKKGRKLPLSISAIGLALSTLAFGFSTCFTWALVTRLLQGCFMSLNVLGKSKVADICDDTNFSHGFSILISSVSVGRILGPSMAGFLVFPAEQYPTVFSESSVFGRFPILFPMGVLAVGLVLSDILMIIYLPSDFKKDEIDNDERTRLIGSETISNDHESNVESNAYDSNDEWNGCESSLHDSNVKLNGYDSNIKSNGYDLNVTEDENDIISKWPNIPKTNQNIEISSFQYCNDKNEPKISHFMQNNKRSKILNRFSELKCCSLDILSESRIMRALKTKECFISCILYAVYSFASVGSSETFPLFVATSKNLNGFAFTTADIGLALLVASIFLLIFQFSIQSRIESYLGSRNMLMMSMLVLVFLFPILPSLAAITDSSMQWFLLCLWLFLIRALIALSNLAVNVFLKQSVTHDLLGSAIGLGQAANSVGSMISPSVYGAIYAWSLTNVVNAEVDGGHLGFPFNQYLVFFLQSLWAIFIAVIVSQLSKDMGRKKVVKEDCNS